MGQLIPRLKPSLNMKRVIQEDHQYEESMGTKKMPGITPETPRQTLANIIGGELGCLELCLH